MAACFEIFRTTFLMSKKPNPKPKTSLQIKNLSHILTCSKIKG